jgi:hypothetical protein
MTVDGDLGLVHITEGGEGLGSWRGRHVDLLLGRDRGLFSCLNNFLIDRGFVPSSW